MKTEHALIIGAVAACWKFSQLSDEGRSDALQFVTQSLEAILADPVGCAMRLWHAVEEGGGARFFLAAIACKLMARRFRRSAEKKKAAAEKAAAEKAAAAAPAADKKTKKKAK